MQRHCTGHAGRECRLARRRRAGHREPDVDDVGERPPPRMHQRRSAADLLVAGAAQAERGPGRPGQLAHGLAQRLDVPYPDRPHGRGDDEFVAAPHRAGGQRSGHHRAVVGDAYGAVHPDPHRRGRVRRREAAGQAGERGEQIGQALAGDRARRDRLHLAQAGGGDPLFGPRQRVRRVGEIGASDDQQAAADPQGVQHGEMILRLLFPALVGGHDEQHGRDRSDPRDHRGDETLVAGHVDKGQLLPRWQGQPRVPQVGGRARAAPGLPAMGIHPGQRPHQGGLAVTRMPGRRDDPHQARSARGASLGGSTTATIPAGGVAAAKAWDALFAHLPGLCLAGRTPGTHLVQVLILRLRRE